MRREHRPPRMELVNPVKTPNHLKLAIPQMHPTPILANPVHRDRPHLPLQQGNPLANKVLEPMVNLKEEVSNRQGPTVRALVKGKTGVKAKAKGRARVKAKARAKDKVRAKLKARAKAKARARVKDKVRVREREKDKGKVKAKVRDKDKVRERVKARAKDRAKAKDKVRAKVKDRGRKVAAPMLVKANLKRVLVLASIHRALVQEAMDHWGRLPIVLVMASPWCAWTYRLYRPVCVLNRLKQANP